ncbi:MAG: hypothetical protein ACTSXQ_01340 [Alphaproteobacteria bacterium]
MNIEKTQKIRVSISGKKLEGKTFSFKQQRQDSFLDSLPKRIFCSTRHTLSLLRKQIYTDSILIKERFQNSKIANDNKLLQYDRIANDNELLQYAV